MRNDPVELVTPRASEPVGLPDLKAHLRHNLGDAEDDLLAELVGAAADLFERHTGRPVLPTVFRQWLPGLGEVHLLRANVTAVASVTYFDADGETAALADWRADLIEVPAVVYLPGGAYPAVQADRRRVGYVQFTAGWPDAAAVPKPVKTAIKLLAAHWYRFREAYQPGAELAELPQGFRAVCDLYDSGLTRGG